MSDANLVWMAGREVRDRHAAFVAWFTQGCEAAMAATERAFAPDMERVSPDGARQGREALVAGLRAARGTRDAAFEIAIEDAGAIWTAGDAVLLGYVERQRSNGWTTRRRATALLIRDEGAPNGVAWHFVQETWIDPA